MDHYKNLSGDSGVLAYELSPDAIVVQFNNGWKYEYTNHSAGASAIDASSCAVRERTQRLHIR